MRFPYPERLLFSSLSGQRGGVTLRYDHQAMTLLPPANAPRCLAMAMPSRGGLTTKIHALVDANGLPITLKLTKSQAYDGKSGQCHRTILQ